MITNKDLEITSNQDITLNLNSGAIHIENKASIKQRLAWLFFAWKAIPVLKNFEKTDLEEKIIKIKVNLSEIKNSIGYESNNNEHLKEILQDLVTTKVSWNIFNKERNIWGACSLLSFFEVESYKDKAICTYAFNPFIQSKLANPEMYAKINLLITKNISSKNSLAIYCIALDYLDIKKNYGEKSFTIEEIRAYLGLKESDYKNSGDFYKWVIKSSEEDINKNTDMNLSIEVKRVDINKKKSKIIGFKLKMSIKNEFLDNYKVKKPLKLITDNKQTNIFEDIEVREIEEIKTQSIKPEVKPKREIIKVESKELKEFFAEYKISITTNTIQDKLIEVKEIFKDKFEDYLIFLMNYTKQELKRTSITNISGFYVSLLKDDNQIDNYIVEMQNKDKEKEKNREKINYLIQHELKKKYNDYLSKDFDTYLISNIEKLESKIIKVLKEAKDSEFVFGFIKNKEIDKELILTSNIGIKVVVKNYLRENQDKLGYKALTFEEWKAKEVTEEEIKEIEKNLI